MDRKISLVINEICKKHGIYYTSINPNFTSFLKDAKRLGEIILEINSLIDELENIFQRHNIQLKSRLKLENDLEDLKNLDHDLIKLATIIKNE